MENDIEKKWVRIIALLLLIGAVFAMILWSLICLSIIDLSIIEETFTVKDHIDFLFGSFISLVIFIGLWKFSSWGWKTAVFIIPLYSAYDFIDIVIIDYERGVGVLFAPFLLVNGLILSYLLKPNVRNLFSLSTNLWKRMQWSVNAIYIMASFLFVFDFVNDIAAVVLAISLFFGYRIAIRYRQNLIN